MKNFPQNRTDMAGFTLLEVLVALLVLMVGILGVSTMQLFSFQANQNAYYRSQATYIGAEILDRIRINPDVTAYASYATINIDSESADAFSNPNCADSVNGCTAAQEAEQDIREWAAYFVDVFSVTDFKPTLPNSSATVTRAVGTDDFTVQINWSEKTWDDNGTINRGVVGQSVLLTATMPSPPLAPPPPPPP